MFLVNIDIMEKTNISTPKISRRKLLSSLGLLFLVDASASTKSPKTSYTEVIDKDGKLVKVPLEVINKAKVVKSKANNRDMFNWLKNKR